MCDIHPSAHVTRFPRARLPHRCVSCGLDIMPGEVYRLDSGVWDGTARDHKRHVMCAVLEDQLVDDEGCWLIGNLSEAHNYPAGEGSTFRSAWETVMGQKWTTNRCNNLETP